MISMKGAYNLCRNCMKWMEHRYIGMGEGHFTVMLPEQTTSIVYLYVCANCGTISMKPVEEW